MFHRYELRTTDLAAARTFYETVLARPLDPSLAIIPLPERARAAGAPAHWLGHLVVEDPVAVRDRIVALGGEVRGPALRDPYGAMIALDAAPATPTNAVVWHQRNTREPERVRELYAELSDWRDAGIYDIRQSPQTHEAWLFFFAVDDLDAALARARAHHAVHVSDPIAFGDGRRAAYLDDAQGAAFGLIG
jgi:uncharacterized protein